MSDALHFYLTSFLLALRMTVSIVVSATMAKCYKGWISMAFDGDSHKAQRLNCNEHGCATFLLLCHYDTMSPVNLEGLPYTLVQTLLPSRKGIPQTFCQQGLLKLTAKVSSASVL